MLAIKDREIVKLRICISKLRSTRLLGCSSCFNVPRELLNPMSTREQQAEGVER